VTTSHVKCSYDMTKLQSAERNKVTDSANIAHDTPLNAENVTTTALILKTVCS